MTTQYSIGDLNRDEWLTLLGIASADDPKLAALAALSWGGNALKLLRVNATENGWEFTAVAAGEPPIAAGTTGQYWRGDKTWQTLNKAAVGLGNADNTSDADKPVSTAQATALALKAALSGATFTGAVNFDLRTQHHGGLTARSGSAIQLNDAANTFGATLMNDGTNIATNTGLVVGGTLSVSSLVNAADDAAAATAGVPVGRVYRNGSALMIRVT